jgi:hypothetical protein
VNALLITTAIQTAGHCDDELVQFLVDKAAALCSTWHTIEVLDSMNCEQYMMTFFNQGQICLRAGTAGTSIRLLRVQATI